MELDVKGHSGCDIEVVREGNSLYILKSTHDPKYLKRLLLQAEKQAKAAIPEYQHIRVPKVLDIEKDSGHVCMKMDYVYSKNFVEYFEHAGFEQINYLIDALIMYLEREIKESPLTTVERSVVWDKFVDVKEKTLSNPHLKGDAEVEALMERSEKIFSAMGDMRMPVGKCHGDLTFSNILFNGNNYYLIDFLDSFIESPLLDIVKIRQDTAWLWSQLMYVHPFDKVRLKIVCGKIDEAIHSYFSRTYEWYGNLYPQLQLMNFLRILQYAHEERVIDYLKRVINEQLNEF